MTLDAQALCMFSDARFSVAILDGIIGHEGNGPSGGEPRYLGILGASANVFAFMAMKNCSTFSHRKPSLSMKGE